MKNIKNVKAIITAKTKFATVSILAISSLSVQAQLSIYGGSEDATAYNNIYNSNSYVNQTTTSTPTYPTTSSQVKNYQTNSYNSYNPYKSSSNSSYNNTYNNSYNSVNNSYNSSYNNSYNNSYNSSYNNSYNSSYNNSYNSSYNNSYNSSYNNSYNQSNALDKLGGLIEKKASEYQYQTTILDEARNNAQDGIYDDIYEVNSFSNNYAYGGQTFEAWQNKHGNRLRVKAYRKYLVKHLGANNVPPMSQLLQTAKSWRKCGGEPYSVPPVYYWHNMVPTLRLFATLKSQGIIPADTKITSVYRSSRLNRCVGGANGSKHKVNSALDLSSPSMKKYSFKLSQVQDNLCNFWLYQGHYYKFGLGLYSKGSIHIDTSKYRKWGNNYSSGSSPCRSNPFF